ncbi:hypothetical protein, partial [Acinetobacter baumannii]|uniref:hypothetical protein n=1 Tax=Acinetobacter baumannii TaxID=470 RepID=UPI0020915727
TPVSGLERIVPTEARRKPLFPRAIKKATGAVLILAFWGIGSAVGWISPDLFPSPQTMARTFLEMLASGEFA